MEIKNKRLLKLSVLTASILASQVSAENVKVDINLDIKHEVKGVSDFNREKHITVHSNLTESDWNDEAEAMNYLMNDLDVYFGRDNGMASWIFRASAQDPENLGKPDLADLANFGQWHKDNMYDSLPESLRAYEARSSEMIMGITPHGPFPTQSYWAQHLAGKDEEPGKYVLRRIEDGAEWVGEYLDLFFRKNGESSGVLMPKYWEVINEPDMDVNVGHTFVMSSFEQIFEYHNLVAEQIKSKLPEGERPLVGGMTWGLHDLDKADLSTRFPDQQKAVRNRYALPTDEAGQTLEDFLQGITASDHWDVRKDDFYQWDYLWKGFMDAAGHNMDFYSIHLYDWSPMGDDPRKGGTFRGGMTTEAILEMVEWYDAQVNGKENLKPWVISEYGAIAQKGRTTEFLANDYRYADWVHIRTFNQMFMQLLTRPSQIVKSMPFAPIKAKWGAEVAADGRVVRYEPSLLQTDEPLSPEFFSDDAEWYVTDKIQWFELWSDVKGTRVDTHSNDPDIQVDAYVDGNHTYLILNNLEWYDIPVDLSFMGADSNSIQSVNMKHSYLAEGLSPTNLGRPVLAHAMLDQLPDSVTLEPGSTIVLDIEYNDALAVTEVSNEIKYYSESLSGAGKGQAAKGQVHRVLGNTVTAFVNGVDVPTTGEATLRIAARMYPFHASNKREDLNSFTINGHTLDVRKEVNPNAGGTPTEHLDFMGAEVDAQGIALNLIEIPVPLEYLQENNTIEARVNQGKAFTAVSISVWDMTKEAARSDDTACDPCTIASDLTISGDTSVLIKETIALSANVLPVDTSNKTVYWTTSDVTIASVDQNGLVTGTGSGTATINAATEDGVLVAEHYVSVETIQVTSVDIALNDAELGVGQTLVLDVSIEPLNATTKTLNWTSSNEGVATVSESGVVTAISDGSTTIKATAIDGGVDDSISITVTSVPLTSVTLPSTSVIVLPGSYQAMANFTPSNATNLEVTWQSANPSMATVNSSGLITGVSEGTTAITVTADDGGLQDTIIVSVLNESDVTNSALVVESETTNNTGGEYGGFSVSDVGINNNQTGDWAEYSVNFAEAGVYRFILDAGTPTASGTGVEVYINGVSAGSADVPSTGDWDVMQSTVVTNALLVPTAGVHTIRIESIGAPALWQWNSDKISFVLLSSLTPEVAEPDPIDPDVPVDPEEPVDPDEPIVEASLTLDDASKYASATYTVGESIDVTATYHAGGSQTVTSVHGGVKFLLREMTADWGTVVNDVLAFDGTAIGQTSGTATATLSLADITPTADLSAGNFYFLFAIFNSTSGSEVKIGGVFPINIVAAPDEPVDPPTDPVDPPVDPVDPVDPGEFTDGAAFVIEAESFDATGGDYAGSAGVVEGLRGYPNDKHTVIDSVQTTDWVDYIIDFPTSDYYRVDMLVSGQEPLANATLFVDGILIQETPIHTGAQAIFETFALTDATYIEAGIHTVRVQATSTKRGWMWFGDNFTFTQLIGEDSQVFAVGDFDQDADIDNLDVRLFSAGIRSGEITDMAFDFNNDGQVNRSDSRALSKLCTRTRCAVE